MASPVSAFIGWSALGLGVTLVYSAIQNKHPFGDVIGPFLKGEGVEAGKGDAWEKVEVPDAAVASSTTGADVGGAGPADETFLEWLAKQPQEVKDYFSGADPGSHEAGPATTPGQQPKPNAGKAPVSTSDPGQPKYVEATGFRGAVTNEPLYYNADERITNPAQWQTLYVRRFTTGGTRYVAAWKHRTVNFKDEWKKL